MRLHTRYWIAAALLLAAAGAASAGVTVRYESPEKFNDMPDWEQDRVAVLKDFSAHFDKLGKDLAPGQELKVTVTDIDLAGRIEPRRRTMHDIRILRGGADWPSMQLQYSLEQDGKVLASGSEHVSNMMYLGRMNRYPSEDALRYEKQMLDEWFQKTFQAQRLSAK